MTQFTVVTMPQWKYQVLRVVYRILGMKGYPVELILDKDEE